MGGLLLISVVLLACSHAITAQYYGRYYCQPGRDVFVHLFEWKWPDVEKECTWLALNNYCAIQISPPNEHRIVTYPLYPWWQRYQPVSYELISRSGTEAQFRSMVTTCNNLGVYIYADTVINHMTGAGTGVGSGGSFFDGNSQSFPAVPYTAEDFNGPAECPTSDLNIQDDNDAVQTRNCRLVGLADLKQGATHARDQIVNYLNKLISWGVAGFRIDSAKHMWPGDIQVLLGRLNSLNTTWFPANTKPYVYQEVIDVIGSGAGGVKYTEYVHIGHVTEFRYGPNLGDTIRKNYGLKLASLQNFGEAWNQLDADDAIAFIDDHDVQRGHGPGGVRSILTFFEPNTYKIGNAFQLAWPYGHVRIMSSYYWPRDILGDIDKNDWMGPPSDSNGNTKDADCFSGDWICEHRWPEIANMVKFHNVVMGTNVVNWWDNRGDAIAFGRGNSGFIVINNEVFSISETLQTGLPAGTYCDVITCDNNRPPCGNSRGTCRPTITVDESGLATFNVPSINVPVIAIHV